MERYLKSDEKRKTSEASVNTCKTMILLKIQTLVRLFLIIPHNINNTNSQK